VSNFVKIVDPFPSYANFSKSSMAVGSHLGFPQCKLSDPQKSSHFWLCVSNFVKIGHPFPNYSIFEIQYGGRPPSWIPHNANIEVNLSTEVAFCLCVSNFVKIGRSVPELRHFFEIQYGGRSPSWIPEMYAFCQLALNRMPSYANVENFMPIG
jgi:hypothetical protein